MLDLLNLFEDDDGDKPTAAELEQRHSKADLSGKKIPKNVRAILNSGIEVQCDVRYDGQSAENPLMRRYLVQAEVDWSKYWIKMLIVGELPLDVSLRVQVPDTTSSEHKRYAATMQTIVEKRV